MVIKCTILVDPSLVIIAIPSFSDLYSAVKEKILKENISFIWHIWSVAYSSTITMPRGSWNLQYWLTLSIAHHYNMLSLSDLYLGVKKKIFEGNNVLFTIWLIWPHPSTRTPVLGVTKFTILELLQNNKSKKHIKSYQGYKPLFWK